jgi:hypothetical protein
MAANARIVLADCREAHAELVDGLVGSLWRRRWATVVVLLRTTCDVLAKVDYVEGTAAMRAAADNAWAILQKDRPTIYFDFIKGDRDSLVHQYKYLAGQNVTVHVGEGRSEITYSMNKGPYAGEDPRAVARQAIDWLEQYLTDIDSAAAVGAPGPGHPSASKL